MEELEINPETAPAPEENAALPAETIDAPIVEAPASAADAQPEIHADPAAASEDPAVEAAASEEGSSESAEAEALQAQPAEEVPSRETASADAASEKKPAEAAAPEANVAEAAPPGEASVVAASEEIPEEDATAESAPVETPLSLEEAAPIPIAISDAHLQAILEAVVYVADEPLTLIQIAAALALPVDRIETLLRHLAAEFERPEHGIGIREVAGGFKMATKAEHHEAVRSFVKSLKPPLKLSLPALETLAVIAYKQPVTAPEIMEIRGVQGAGVLKTLLDRKLIAAAGRKNVIGKPILYKTTKEFLIQFGLKDIAELPSIKEFEEIRRMAFADNDAAPAAEPAAAPAPEAVTAPAPEAVPAGEPAAEPEAEPAPGPASAETQAETPSETPAEIEPEPHAPAAPAPEPEA